jgi:hypothetical protein
MPKRSISRSTPQYGDLYIQCIVKMLGGQTIKYDKLLSTSRLNKLEDGENPRVKFNDIVWHLMSATASDFGDEHVHEDEDAFDWVSRVRL